MVFFMFFILKPVGKGHRLMLRPLFLIFNGGMTYETKEKGLIKESILFVGRGVYLTEQHMEEWLLYCVCIC